MHRRLPMHAALCHSKIIASQTVVSYAVHVALAGLVRHALNFGPCAAPAAGGAEPWASRLSQDNLELFQSQASSPACRATADITLPA